MATESMPDVAPGPVVAAAAAAPAPLAAAEEVQNASLYVGDLDKDVQETHLFELFNQVGPVHSIRVCRDTVTRRSLGYAYVNFNASLDPDAAKNALDQLNYKEVKGKPIRIMWANRNPNARKNKDGNIFIKNLEKDVTTRLLHDTFAEFGTILSCKVALDKDLKSKGYGFVHFEEPEAAEKAIQGVNGMKLGDSDKIVTVCEFLSRNERGDSKRKFTNLYVKGLPEKVQTKEDLEKMFGEFGDISSAVIKTDEHGRKYGFVNFETPEAATKAKESLHDKEVDGAKLFVDRAQKKGEREDLLKRRYDAKRNEMMQEWEGKNLYVKNLAENVDEEMLTKLFKEHGEIASCKIMRDPRTKASRGFGFVCFTNVEDAQTAMGELSRYHLEGKPLYVSLAQPKAVRQQHLQQMMKMSAMAQPMMPQGRGMNGPLPGMPGMGPMGFNMAAYPGMMPYGRGMMPMNAMYPGMMQNGGRGGQGGNGGRGGAGAGGMNGMMQMAPAMMQMNPAMMQMNPGMMQPGMMGGGRGAGRQGGRSARGGRGGRGGRMGRGGPGSPQPGAQPGGARGGDREPELASKLATMPEQEQKQHLGELLFPKIEVSLQNSYSPENADKLASKITGMFLEMDTSALLYLLDTDSELGTKIDEALEVLRQHGAMPDGCQ